MACAVFAIDASLLPVTGALPARARPAATLPVGRVDDELIRGQVGPGVVEDVAEALRGQDADQHGDQHAERDGGEGRARAGPVPGQVAQGQPGRDRGPAAQPGQQREARRGQQDHRRDQRDEAEDEFERAAAVAVGRAGVGEQDRGPAEQDQAGQRRAVDLLRRRGPPGQGGHDRDPGDRPGRPGGGEIGGHDGEGHGHADHGPRQLERRRSGDGRPSRRSAGRPARRPGRARTRPPRRRRRPARRWPGPRDGCSGRWRPARPAAPATAAGAARAP